jgi:hypothetical protein
MSQIFVLKKHSGQIGDATTDFLKAGRANFSDARLCEACGGAVGLLRWEPPYRVELETWGGQFGDLAFGPGEAFLVSERFARLWKEEGLVGLEGFHPVEIVKVKRRGKRIKEGPPRYFVVWPVYSEVAVDQERSGFQWEEPPKCGVCREGLLKGYDRIVLEGEPRENVFMPRRLGVVLADERFKEFCDRHGITNCLLIPAERARWPWRQGSADR